MLKSSSNRKNIQPHEIAVTLQKSKEKGLGFLVKKRLSKPYVVVSEILKGGPADRSGVLRVGDVILAVNQHSLAQAGYKEALNKLRNIPIDGNAVLLVKGKSPHPTQLQAVVSQGGVGKTIRIPQILPKINTNHQKKAEENSNGEKKKEKQLPISNNNTANKMNGEMRNALPPQSKETEKKNIANGLEIIPRKNAPSSALKYTTLRNWETSSERRDTLHLKACPVNVCQTTQCKGSVMNPTHMTVDPRTWQRPIEETQRLAKDFIDQYFESTKRTGKDAHAERLEEVRKSIEETGTYKLTEPELIFGAKTAWRNAPRCIGRIQWNKLQVFDCRHVTTAAEMFEAICKHLRYATNKGNIRSCITFFPPRTDVKTEYRVWNPQLIRYAGYQQNNGTVVGDPVNVEFTRICQRLGWQGKGTRFDVLPLVLQANGEDPQLYELPEDLILEVKIRHPLLKWWKDLEMKWYAVPAVSNMLLDIGGVLFPGCPFNGWFMGTEIGRDLCDISRYNLLEPIALKMGLNTSNLSSLWKDKALLEMNVAIMHSFQSDRVTIMDHHVATESFMKHFENELKLRNGCPGDWVWLVPPISGSATPIFHQEILNYMLNPNCYYQLSTAKRRAARSIINHSSTSCFSTHSRYRPKLKQPDPWKYYTWKSQCTIAQKRNRKIKFKDVARTVMLTSSMMTKAMSKRAKATILYATETGKSQMFAEQLKGVFNFAFNAKVIAMSDYDIWQLEYESILLVVTSTFGNGDPPENGEVFAHELQKMNSKDKHPQRKKRFDCVVAQAPINRRKSYFQRVQSEESIFTEATEQQGQLANVKFSVFGLGSTAYPNFCAFAHAIDSMLGEMGAERLLEIGEGDELAGQEESFKKWTKAVFGMACESSCIEEDVNIDSAADAFETKSYEKSKLRVNVQENGDREINYVKDLGMTHRKKLFKCSLVERSDLHPRQPHRATILVKLQKDDPSQLPFEPGDHIGIYPCNDPQMVKELLKRIQDVPHENTLIQLETLQERKTAIGNFKNWISDKRLPLCSLWAAFSRYLDITSPPSPNLLKLLAGCAVNDEDKARLEVLSKGSEEYVKWKFNKVPNLLEIFDEFPSLRVELALLLSQLPLLQCRYYSISSSPAVHPDQIHCTISVVSYYTEGGNGPLHHGVCSTYIDRLEPGEEVFCFIRHASSFHLPPDPSTPCILVGPGTGIAPFRSFWQQRLHLAEQKDKLLGTMALLFGCRSPSDHAYKCEVEEALNRGALTHSYTAYSRLPETPKTYVQDIMESQIPDIVFSILCQNSGHLYVCGDVKMANDVTKAVKRILISKGEMKEVEAERWIQEMKNEERYHEDIFGVTLRFSEVHENKRQEAKRKSIKHN